MSDKERINQIMSETVRKYSKPLLELFDAEAKKSEEFWNYFKGKI